MRRFAIWSMVLGTLAIAGGASALAFDGTSGDAGSAPAQVTSAPTVDVAPVSTSGSASGSAPGNAAAWVAPHALSFDPTPID